MTPAMTLVSLRGCDFVNLNSGLRPKLSRLVSVYRLRISAKDYTNRYEQARNVMIQTVKDIWFLSQPKRTLNISEHLLLAPCWNNCFTQKYDRFIKEALFQFLADINRKL